MINEWLVVTLAAQALTSSTPLVLAGCGELVAERAGVLNIGIEGMMLTGCISAFAVTAMTGNGWLGLAAGMMSAMAMGAVFAVMAINARTDQIVAGMAINLLAVGASGVVWRYVQEHRLTDLPPMAGFERPWLDVAGLVDLPLVNLPLVNLPLVGPLVFNQYGLSVATVGLLVVVWWLFRATRLGVVIDALGQAPEAAVAAGEPLRQWRWAAVLFAAGCAGAAGAFLSIMRTHAFVPEMTGGKGFVVLALVMFGRWRVGWMAAGCLLFGLTDSVQQHLQSLPGSRAWPFQVFQVLPYVVAIAALACLSRSAPGPAALGKPWPTR